MLEDIRLAFQGIWNHKLRSALTMLGIIIGIGSIIAIVSTIKGTNEQIKENLVGAGNNAVNIQLYQGEWPIDLSYGNVPDGVPVISKDVLEEIKESDAVETAALYYTRNEYDAVFNGSQSLSNGTIMGVDSDYLDVYGYHIVRCPKVAISFLNLNIDMVIRLQKDVDFQRKIFRRTEKLHCLTRLLHPICSRTGM